MKNIALIKNMRIFFVMMGVLAITSCQRNYLDAQPDNLLTLDEIFTSRVQTEKWWAGLFQQVPNIWQSRFSLITDELDDSNWNSRGDNNGNPGGINRAQLYEKIRLASIFLENIDRNQEIRDMSNGDQLIKHYKGEARFIRAYYYWYLMKYLGPVVIVPTESGSPTDNFQIPRSTWDESVAFVLNELALAKEDLPLHYTLPDGTPNSTQLGRINKVIVTALESQILLFHASPLYNGNTDMSDFRNLDGKILLSQTYDPQRWQKAADKALEAIELAHSIGKQLYRVGNPSTNFADAVTSTQNLYWAGYNTEGIWLRPPQSGDGDWELTVAPRSVEGTGYNGYAVVQSLVDAYRMNNGQKIQESSSYNENTYTSTGNNYYVAGTNTMYTNREARFYAHINFNGAITPGVPKAGADNARVEFFRTGNSGKDGSPRDWPKTGYTPRKNLFSGYSRFPHVTTIRPTMLIRLAELYLNYAEALNEANPSHPDVLEYLNRVRRRAGLPDMVAGLSQAQMREEIRLERRIELSFELHRFSDVRRWKVADRPGYNQGGAFYGMNMDGGTHLSDPEFHRRTVAFTRAPFNRRYYFLPYGQDEMDRNHELVEFPGY